MVKLTMGQALLQWTQSVETLLLHSLNIPTTQACFSRSFISIHGKELSVGCFKSIVWKGFEVLLPEALYKTVSGPNSHKRTAEWGGANVYPPYSTKICTVTAYFYRSPAITDSFWTVTDHEPAWSQLWVWRYALNITMFTSIFHKVVRNWQMPSNTVM